MGGRDKRRGGRVEEIVVEERGIEMDPKREKDTMP